MKIDSLPTLPYDSVPEAVAVGDVSLDERGFDARYVRRALLGQGGMGEVHIYRDERIGREVALKVMRGAFADDPDLRRRFVREARLQGQLEHPAVVPVHDLGLGADGAAWFTMKRVRGRTLGDVFRALRHGDGDVAGKWTARRLLSALSSLCLAVDFAHEKGVVHRDLKPANVMLGDFGEVYLLDWGLARVLSESEPGDAGTSRELVSGRGGSGDPEATLETASGVVLGSPGYMSPEQVRGEPAGVASDVYALGAILFEVLTGERMNRGDSAVEARQAALVAADRPSLRAPGRAIAPELDAICERATALSPADRYPSARALHDAVERYLDGDRDLALRKELAVAHVAAAAAAAAAADRAAAAPDPGAESVEREHALREAGQAVALDPRNEEASRLMMRLLMTPPRTLPAEARAAVEHDAAVQEREAQRSAVKMVGALMLIVPVVLALGLRNPALLALATALNLVVLALNLYGARTGSRSPILVGAAVLTTCANVLVISRSMGPFILTPTLALVSTMGFLLAADRRMHRLIIVAGFVGLLGPVALELLGVLPRSFAFRDGNLVILPQMHSLPEVGTLAYLLVQPSLVLLGISLLMMRLRGTLEQAQERVHVFAWSLGRFLPGDALRRAGASP